MLRPFRPKEPPKEFLSFEGIAEFDIWRNSDGSVRLNLDEDRILCLKIYKMVTNPVYDEQMEKYKKKLEEYEIKKIEFDEWAKNSGLTATEILDRFGSEK